MEIVMITGVSSGIGRATAEELAREGYHVVAAGRSEQRTVPVVEKIVSAGGSAEFLDLDLSSLASVAEAARSYLATGRDLDVLIANAGVGGRRGITTDGFEIHFGVNHLGHFLLTHLLGPALRPQSRVVVVSSEMHRRAMGIPFPELRRKTRTPGGVPEYAVSKLANILFARHLAKERPDLGTFSLHPGVVDTNIFPRLVSPFIPGKLTPEAGSATSVWCATARELSSESGGYYDRMRRIEPSSVARDGELAAELWARSMLWCGVTGDD